jgi:hypothetical protein
LRLDCGENVRPVSRKVRDRLGAFLVIADNESEREAAAAITGTHNSSTALKQQPRPLLRARHQRPLAPIKNKDGHFLLSQFALTGVVALPFPEKSSAPCLRAV